MSGVVYYFYTNIKPILVTEINKALAVEVNVGDISISGIRDFPNLGVKFTTVTINESTPFYQKKLLEAANEIYSEKFNCFLVVDVMISKALDRNKITAYVSKPSLILPDPEIKSDIGLH